MLNRVMRRLRSDARRIPSYGALRRGSRATWRAAAGDAIALYWYDGTPNFGDALSPLLAQRLSGKPVVSFRDVWHLPGVPIYSSIGSILQREITPRVVVWGSGIMTDESTVLRAPAAVHAVRGPLTREVLLRQGIACPAVYGDPALLVTRFWAPAKPSDDIVVVPHFFDRELPAVTDLAERLSGRIIDVSEDVDDVIDAISGARAVVSSSLHGLIVAAAYGKPAAWVQFSRKIPGDGFKFRDFFLSIGRGGMSPVMVTSGGDAPRVADAFTAMPLNLDLDRLLAACPFRSAGYTH